jgi:hypothetical protein
MQTQDEARNEGPRVETAEGLLGTDLAGTHRARPSDAASRVDPAQFEADWTRLCEDGFVVMEGLLAPAQLDEIRAAFAPHFGPGGRNPFEGFRTQRVYSVLEKTRAADRLVDHPRVLALLDRLLAPNYLLSALLAIRINPGEAAQGLHYDEAFYCAPRPRPALAAATVWAIDDFTHTNGATQVIPGSQRWDDARIPGAADPLLPVVMPAGSVVLFPGTLWHGGGANRSPASRFGLTAQYCQPWLRQQENFSLALSRETARAVSDDIRRLLGYSIHPPFMGHVNGMSPLRVLERA